jgi:hypothetical protein
MITPFDTDYKATKKIKQGKTRLAGPLAELAVWIASTWSVNVLNVIYDGRDAIRAPRLQIILEFERDTAKFRSGGYFDYDKEKEDAIKNKFREIATRDPFAKFDLEGLFIFFGTFAPVAGEEAVNQTKEKEIEDLKDRIGNADLWKIRRSLGNVTFFFFTDGQVELYTSEGKKREYAKLYFGILKPHDEFGYISENDFTVAFDSKQNLDENFENNWFYYDRG